jgi:phenylpyruvate tautomerase PptA (4-oxalocrotonate tautomerase family)
MPLVHGYGPDTVFVEAMVFPGRSLDAKRKLYRLVVEGLKAAGVARDRVLIVLHEPPLENWGIRGGQAATDVQLGFKIDV